MTTQPITTAPPDTGEPGATSPRGGPPGAPATSFEDVLSEHEQAWTADAGGQQSREPATAEPTDAAAALAAQASGAPIAVPVATAPVVPQGTALEAPTVPGGPAVPAIAVAPDVPAAAGGPGVPATSAAPAVPGTTVPVATGADAAPAEPALPVAPAAAAPADAPATTTTTTTTPAGPAPAATATDASSGTGTGPSTGGSPQGDVPEGDQPPAAAAAARGALAGPASQTAPAAGDTAAPAASAAPATAPAPPTAPAAEATAPAAPAASPPPSTSAAAPAAPAAPVRPDAAPVQPPAPVPVAQAAEVLRDLIHLARSRDAAHARLVLHPADLGGVEVHLRQTADGLKATVRAEHPEALQVLERGLGDLRRGLEARGVNVESIDLGLAGDQQERRPETGGAGFGDRTGRVTTLGVADDAPDDPLTTPIPSTVRLSAGALVDVMA